MKDFLQLAADRYSVRKYTDEPVTEEAIGKIIQAARLAPTARNMQPFRIFVLKSEEARAKAAKSTSFEWLPGAPVMFVVGVDHTEGWTREFDGKPFADVDGAIVGTHIMMQAFDLGLGTVWIGHFDPAVLKAAFPEMAKYDLIGIFPVGHISPEGRVSTRHSLRKSREELVEEF